MIRHLESITLQTLPGQILPRINALFTYDNRLKRVKNLVAANKNEKKQFLCNITELGLNDFSFYSKSEK